VTASGEQVMQNLRERLARILGDSSSTAELSAVLEEIAETWRGLCNIEVSFAPEVESAISQDQICVETVLEIIREACSNAIRHGSAERIWLTLEIEGTDLVRVTVTNDGNARDKGGKPGLGSAYLDDCTFSHERAVAGDLMTLSATVPLHE
jgi:signal transduction histidine kinase